MSKRRRLHPPRREPNGKPQRPTLAQLEAVEREKGEREMSVVLAQPHRRGERSHLAESALGRFVLRHKLLPAIFDAGQEYAATVRRWRAAKGIPRTEFFVQSGRAADPTDQQVHRWRRTMDAVEAGLARQGFRAYYAARTLILENRDVPEDQAKSAIAGLLAVAVALDFHRANSHPYLTGA